VWSRVIAPSISAIILAIALWLIVSNFELLTGGTREFALVLASTAIIALVIGLVLYSLRVKHLNPNAAKDLAQEIS
jgi:predicted PurR-regulated permease PerM